MRKTLVVVGLLLAGCEATTAPEAPVAAAVVAGLWEAQVQQVPVSFTLKSYAERLAGNGQWGVRPVVVNGTAGAIVSFEIVGSSAPSVADTSPGRVAFSGVLADGVLRGTLTSAKLGTVPVEFIRP
jgi:hypothetical protein